MCRYDDIRLEQSKMNILVSEARIVAAGVTEPEAAVRTRKPYAAPVLQPLGDIRDVTMAGSAGMGESGAGGAMRKP
jgi:hypothetical protein